MSSRPPSDSEYCLPVPSPDFPGLGGLEGQAFSLNPSLLTDRAQRDCLDQSQWSFSPPGYMWDDFHYNNDGTASVSPARTVYSAEHICDMTDDATMPIISNNTSPLQQMDGGENSLDQQFSETTCDMSETKEPQAESDQADKSDENPPAAAKQRAKTRKSPQKANSVASEKVRVSRSTRKSDRVHRQCRKKPVGLAVPKSLAEATEPDLMMWEWRNAGRSWKDIRTEWQRLTGHHPADSTLSVRYMKINEIMTDHGAASDAKLCEFKKQAEQELCAELWDRVAAKMLAFHPDSEHNPASLKKRYTNLLRSGFVREQTRLETTETNMGYRRFPNTVFNPDLSANDKHASLDKNTAALIASILTSRPLVTEHQQRGVWSLLNIAEIEMSKSPAPLKASKPLVEYDSDY